MAGYTVVKVVDMISEILWSVLVIFRVVTLTTRLPERLHFVQPFLNMKTYQWCCSGSKLRWANIKVANQGSLSYGLMAKGLRRLG